MFQKWHKSGASLLFKDGSVKLFFLMGNLKHAYMVGNAQKCIQQNKKSIKHLLVDVGKTSWINANYKYVFYFFKFEKQIEFLNIRFCEEIDWDKASLHKISPL